LDQQADAAEEMQPGANRNMLCLGEGLGSGVAVTEWCVLMIEQDCDGIKKRGLDYEAACGVVVQIDLFPLSSWPTSVFNRGRHAKKKPTTAVG